jgi:hypothetical protein
MILVGDRSATALRRRAIPEICPPGEGAFGCAGGGAAFADVVPLEERQPGLLRSDRQWPASTLVDVGQCWVARAVPNLTPGHARDRHGPWRPQQRPTEGVCACASGCAWTIKRWPAWASQRARYLTGAGFGVTRAGEGVASERRCVRATAGHARKHRCSPAVAMTVALSLSVATRHADRPDRP